MSVMDCAWWSHPVLVRVRRFASGYMMLCSRSIMMIRDDHSMYEYSYSTRTVCSSTCTVRVPVQYVRVLVQYKYSMFEYSMMPLRPVGL